MEIVDLLPDASDRIHEVAALLVEGFREHHPQAWPTLDSALTEVQDSLSDSRISRVAIAPAGFVLGWIGGIPSYGGHVWELHPLVVHPTYQSQGIGRALVADLEQQVSQRGGLTLWVGTDDENAQTSLSGVLLYPNPLEKLAQIQNLHRHPYAFYQKCGFTLIGAMPDANGRGKPDLFLAKSIETYL
ncbi:GNAT family N-acetyltransferase [Desertifilum sp. FACHB-1129]|uniref:Aminoglycoside 6'-acetyltransferase n=1 Tax=Desertifilum tharense IPPAS B-1220 TaxID=1781255 RepID=A0A1E5QFG8_9CYAN|nr:MULTISPECIES: GNAT family N-acetyltransferase [Desertifilum]MDA0213045.1 GNAT family N-acetyltransferase [Cyanobacteria bacterium FC1]MBD2314860.1 GNAT family N-acetyltransferase [Desertifilum sp. FACHB-1129]MBD2324853.1 GNAT family N-acetyltransferase [Desertifilum sp. FACHB-866]MBD2334899.1 GNAT family N-acetyltransferase [Desertifilum sp. FACHB-868]OEJ73347.1 aminoglycoside 6'-acetyltransferase [Desertifilum tharense IPPAS B-1220]